MSFSPPPNSVPPRADGVAAEEASLRAELDGARTNEQRAQLLVELGALHLRSKDYASAARELLAAINANSTFVEPLDQLICLMERRRSHKNLAKLLERRLRLSRSAIESADVALRLACLHLANQEPEAALRATLEAVEMRPDDPEAWALLRLVASQLDDEDAKCRALKELVRLSVSPARRAWQLLDLAALKLERGDVSGAEADLEEATAGAVDARSRAAESDGATPDPEGELLDAIRIAAYSRLERLGRREGRTDLVERAIRRQAESALGGALPERERLLTLITGSAPSRTATGDTLLRGALWQLGDGSDGDAERLLARARAELGPILAVLLALARRAYRARDAKALEAICVDAGAAGGPAAYLSALRTLLAWLRHQAGEQDASLRDVTEALRLDGTNLSARALDLNLAAERSAVAYAEALERAAVASTESDAQRLWLTAAGAWAFLAGRADDARAAHRRACDAGYSEDTSPALLGLFAAVSLPPERARSALDGITSLATAGPSEWVESLRSHWLEGASERSKAAAAAHRLEREPSGQWLGRAHAAFVAALDEEATSESSALIDLAEVTDSSGTRGVLKSLAALRRRARGDTAGALRVLTDGAATPSNAFQAALLVSLAQRQRDWLTASEALRTEGERTDAPSLRFTLTTAAGFLAWRGGDRNRAIQLFESAQDQDARKAGALVDWARRAHEPDSVALRRANLDAQAGERPDDPHVALERFAMELAPDGDEPEAAMALDRIDTEGQGEAHLAAELARALWAGCGDDARADASLRLATLGDETRGAIAASTFYSELRAGRSEAARTAVQEWSDLDETDPALVERWAMSRAARDHLDEEHTLLALCNVLPAPTNTGVACLAANVSFLRGQNVAPWVFGPGPAADLTNLEHSPPGSAPERRANALGRVVGTAALVSPGASGPALVLVGLNQWASGDTERAEATFREAVAQDPECRTAWDALRDTTRVNGNLDLCCTATATLASLCNTRESAARFYEEAATLCLDELGQETRGHGYLELAVEKDIGRFSAFDRLFRREREANRTTKLLSLIEARLERTDDPDEIVKLYWERARAHRHDGNIDAAMEALGNVRILEPEHAPAMVLTAEILIKDERYEEAAEVLTTLALTESAPQKQRQLSGITAADLFEKKLGDPARALRVVVKMRDFGLQSLPLQERIARAASRVGDWPLALSALETLMLEREDPTAQVEAARLALAIHRDERKDPVGAGNAVACVLGHLPGDAEALDLVLADHFAEPESRAFVERGIEATTDALREDPLDKDRLGRLCRLARYLDRRALIQTTLGCLVVLGQGDAEAARELDQIALGSTRVPQAVLGTEQLELIAGLVTMDPIARLLARIAPELTESLGPNLETLEVSRRDRVKPSAGDPVRSELAAWARAFGLGELEMYVGGIHSSGITAVATEAPAIVAGVRVESPLPPPTIADTVQELWALKHGWTVLRHRSPEDIVAIVRACQVLAGGPQEEGPLGTVSQSAVQVDIERRLGPALSRRLRKELPTLTAALPESDAEILAWVELATLNLDRAAALATGDVSWVLRRTDRSATKGAPPLPEDEARVRTLCGFVLSPQFHALRSALGVAPA